MVNKKTMVSDFEIPFYVKYKYWVFAGIFLVLYYVLFVHNKVDLSFTAKDFEIKTIDNREDFENIIVDNIYDKIVESCEPKKNYNYRYYDDKEFIPMRWWKSTWFWWNRIEPADMWWWMFDGMVGSTILGSSDTGFQEVPVTESAVPDSISFDWTQTQKVSPNWKSTTYSKTNIQKQDVDEWDILKQTKDYVFYFSKNKSKIYIIKSPLDWEKIDLNKVEIVFTINIPTNLTLNPELFVNDNRLVYLASKTSYNNHNTIVWIYDISNLANKDVKLYKMFETKWEYFKSRLVNNKLYLISDYSMQASKSRYCNILNDKNNSTSVVDFISFFTGIKLKWFWLNKELYDELKNELESYSYKFNSDDLNSNWNSSELTKFKLFYTNKDLKESIENLNFNIVSVIDTEKKESDDSQTLLFWNLKNGEIHMTLDNLYLVNSYYQPEKWKCDYIDICYKEFSSNNFTSVSKISYSWSDLKFESTWIIPGKPLNQYSMDEDEWYFRIFTSAWFWNRDASLYVFDNKLKTIWQIENIKPGEEFKSARFIGDKAFLVTFRQIDPLFVIDLHIPSEPKVIWELEIPGYSSYLHPYWKVGNKDYLIWIWKENDNVKVDLYEINYDIKTLWNQIELKQKYSYKFQWSLSQSPAENNPRAFVWDDIDKILYLPIQINWNSHVEECNWNEQWCYFSNYDRFTNTEVYYRNVISNNFYWLKSLKIDIEKWITEVDSYWIKWSYINDSRVWYYKSKDDKALFFVDTNFIYYFKKFVRDVELNFN